MPGHNCAVKYCKNKSNKRADEEHVDPQVSFHAFPKNVNIRNIWRQFCQQGETWNPSISSKVCSIHFTEQNFEMRYKANFFDRKSMKQRLLPNAIPTIPCPIYNQQLYEEHQKQPDEDNVIGLHENIKNLKEELQELRKTIAKDQEDINKLTLYNNTLIKHKLEQQQYITTLEQTIIKLKEELEEQKQRTSEPSVEKLAEMLSPVVTKNQIDCILNKTKVRWTKEEISKAFTLRYFSLKAYKFLRNEGFPLPHVKSLQRYARNINMHTGILHDILNLMAIRGKDLSDIEKITVITYDEMKVTALHEYDIHLDEVFGPHNYAQVVIARGLYSNWKEVVFVKFDTNMTPLLFKEIVTSLYSASFNVVAFVSDCGGANQGVVKNLGINVDKVFVDHPITGKKICYFPDVPHILKLIRNWLLDAGFVLENGSVITKQLLEELITNADGKEVSSLFKLSKKHLDVKKTERQNVALAAQLLSHTTAVALKRYFKNNVEASSLSTFIDNINDWFDIMNSRQLKETIKFKRPFCNTTDQVAKLNEVYETFLTMRCQGKTSLQVFQKAVLISIKSVQILYAEMKQTYGVKFLLTHKLNQDCLENLFSQLRTRGGLDDHPTPLNLLYRLRMIILGKTPYNVKDGKNVVDAEEPSEFITATVLNKAGVSIEGNSIMPEDTLDISVPSRGRSNSTVSSSDVIEKDGLQYLTGWIARKFNRQYPALGQYSYMLQQGFDHDYSLPPWVRHVSYGGLTQPSDLLIKEARFLNRRFKTIHKNKLRFKTKIVTNMVNMLKHMVDLPEEVTRAFLRQRLFIRIKCLNKKLKTNNYQKFKKLSKIVTTGNN